MAKIEIEDAKKIALDFTAKMGSVIWGHEIESLKPIENKWVVRIKSNFLGDTETVYLEIDMDTGKVLSYEKT